MNLSPWPSFDSDQITAVTSVLESGSVNAWTGSRTTLFEKEFSEWCGTTYSISQANGSLALSSAYLAIGLGVGDEFITTPRTFIATASSGVLLGATPVFADVDPESGCITAQTIEPLINSKTKAIVVVHLGGWPADMASICQLARSYDIAVVEDCAQAHGALINGQSVGSFGDVAAWSFCQDKIISTGGEGGMVTTSSQSLWSKIWSFKDHGKSHNAVFREDHPSGYRWLHESFGSNFRITEMQSAIGLLQLKLLSTWTSIRTRNAHFLADYLSDLPGLRIPLPSDSLTHAWYKFYAFIDSSSLSSGWTRDRIVSEIVSRGYPAFSGSCSEIYLEKCFVDAGLCPSRRLPVAKLLGEQSLMFLIHPTIDLHQISSYADVIRSVLFEALR